MEVFEHIGLRNTLFYSDVKIKPGTWTWINVKDFKGDYEWLEETHDYIQWLFPNYYKSKFNKSSFELKFEEA
jgi:hypothetical protein